MMFISIGLAGFCLQVSVAVFFVVYLIDVELRLLNNGV